MTTVIFPHRAVLSLAGPDTIALLERLVTHTTSAWQTGQARYGALLTPQGKIIADYIALRTDHGAMLDVHSSVVEDLAKRLKLFRLRADVKIEIEVDMAVAPGDGFADPRSEDLPARSFIIGKAANDDGIETYNTTRISAGIAEFGFDFGTAEVFPTEVNMDRLGGIDYAKGCFVGQEVVSRMYRRGKIRKRTLVVHGEGLAPGMAVKSGDTPLGEITSISGDLALARLRTDRLAGADQGDITADDLPIALDIPDWLEAEMTANSTS